MTLRAAPVVVMVARMDKIDAAASAAMGRNVLAVDNINRRSNILTHLSLDGRRGLCGVVFHMTQDCGGNGMCRRCAKIAALPPKENR